MARGLFRHPPPLQQRRRYVTADGPPLSPTGTGALTLVGPAVSGTGTVASPVTGTGALSLAGPAVVGTGIALLGASLLVGVDTATVVDVTDFLVDGSLNLREVGYRGTGVLSFSLTGAPGAFDLEQQYVVNWFRPDGDGQLDFAGNVAIVRKRGYDRPDNVLYEVECQDYTTLLSRDVVDTGGVYNSGESDAARIANLVATYSNFADLDATNEVQTLVTVMPTQDFTGKTLTEAIDMVLEQSGGDWYVDFDQKIHTFIGAPSRALTTPFGVAATDLLTCTAHGLVLNDTITFQTLAGGTGLVVGTLYHVIAGSLTANSFKVSATQGGSAVNFTTAVTAGTFVKTATAPHGLSDAPDGVTTFGYRDLSIADDVTAYKDAVYVIPGSAGNVAAAWYGAGSYEAVLTADKVTTVAERDALGAAFLLEHGVKQTGSLTTFEPGLHVGMIVELTNADHGLTAAQYRITAVGITYFKLSPTYRIEFGDPRLTLGGLLSDEAKKAAASAAVAAIEAYNDQREAAAFPVSPTTNDRFYRTDLGMWFVWDGTRWHCTCLHVKTLRPLLRLQFTTTDAEVANSAIPNGASDLYVTKVTASFMVETGTALSASHKWVGVLDVNATSTITINSGSLNVWRQDSAAVNALISGSGDPDIIGMNWTKTGTPGTLDVVTEVAYFIVAT